MAVAAILPAWVGGGEGRKRGEGSIPHLHGDITSGPAGSSSHGQLLGDGGLPGQEVGGMAN